MSRDPAGRLRSGGRVARHVAVFSLSYPPPARTAVVVVAKGAPRLPRLGFPPWRYRPGHWDGQGTSFRWIAVDRQAWNEGLTVLGDGIDGHEELPHGGEEGDLWEFPPGAEAFVVSP